VAAAAPKPSAPAILGRAWDFLFLGPGATLFVSAIYIAAVVLGRPATSMTLVATLSLLVLGPHYAATYRRAYGSLDVLRAHPAVTMVAPVFLVAAAVLAVRSPTGFGPFYFLGYVAWSGYHYSGQSLGITMLYPLRQRARLDAREKRLLAAPLYTSWLVSLIGLAHAESGARNPAYAIVRARFAPVNLPTPALFALLIPLLLSFGCVAVVARERRRRGAPLPAACYGVIAAQVSWFGFGLFFPFFNIALVPIFHSLQYLALTGWHFTRGARAPGLVSFGAYVLVVMALGLVISPGLLAIFAPSDATSTLGPTVAAAVISAINLHHFLMDGRIWRMRERRVAEAFTG
jgi:hypothetical protein